MVKNIQTLAYIKIYLYLLHPIFDVCIELVTNYDRLQALKHSTVSPYVFTEQGVAMLSTVLHSETAVNVSIHIMDAFTAMLDKRSKGVSAKIYTRNISHQLTLDFEKHNAQYAPIEVEQFDRAHDRFLCIDDTVYHVGASLKDLGKKWFGFNRMEWTTDELLSKI